MQGSRMTSMGIFGLGEAGSEIASGLVAGGVEVHAYDPASVNTPEGVERHTRPDTVVQGVDCLLAITAAHDAAAALRQAIEAIPAGIIYADLSTSSPEAKRSLSELAADHGASFVDVALMATVPGSGIHTPQLASGPGAENYASSLRAAGAAVTVVGEEAGAAATRKLLRSIVTKGLAALLLEAREASTAAGLEEWLWTHLVATVEDADEALMSRLMTGMSLHAVRRREEMEATAALLRDLGVMSTMTTATESVLRDLTGE